MLLTHDILLITMVCKTTEAFFQITYSINRKNSFMGIKATKLQINKNQVVVSNQNLKNKVSMVR